ncbi:MAG: hypothetical protein LQ337_003229 [Flavoplaca oasis]|nr:MAG: hypothetical protein LQ337_003229 [Flavoplaca oasis]
MLSRGNSEASARLRRAKSSASIRTRRSLPDAPDPFSAKEQALAAAFHAYGHSSASEISQRASYNTVSQHRQANAGQPLTRSKSIRFAGPAALPGQGVPITIKANQPLQLDHESRHGSIHPRLRHKASSIQPDGALKTNLPPHGEYVETRVASQPSSYRRLRKSRSMFNPGLWSNVTVSSAAKNQTQHSSGFTGQQAGSRLGRSLSFLRPSMERSPSEASAADGRQSEAVGLARDQYFRHLEQQKLDHQPSMANALNRRRSQKTFRKSVRTSSANSYGSTVGSAPSSTLQQTDQKGIGGRARDLSSTFKHRLKRVFNRSSGEGATFPAQQLRATRPHWGNPATPYASSNLKGSITESLHNSELGLRDPEKDDSLYIDRQRGSLAGSIRNVGGELINETAQSGVTSWTNSTAADTVSSQHGPGFDRLSIIRETGGVPSQHGITPSAEVGSQGQQRKTSLFAKLQQRMARSSNGILMELPLGTAGETSNRSLTGLEATSSNHSHTSGPHSNVAGIHNRSESLTSAMEHSPSANMEQHESSSTDFPTVRTETPRGAAVKGPSPKRPFCESKSTFFPHSSHIERSRTSPFRQAMQSSGYTDRKRTTDIVSDNPGKTQQDSYLSATNGIRDRSLTRSESIYSRTSSGNTPKPLDSPSSVARMETSWERYTATLPPRINLEDRRKASTAETRTAKEMGHKKEHAEISGADTDLGRLHLSTPMLKDPTISPCIGVDTRPSLRQSSSQPMIDRFPLMSISPQPKCNNIPHRPFNSSRSIAAKAKESENRPPRSNKGSEAATSQRLGSGLSSAQNTTKEALRHYHETRHDTVGLFATSLKASPVPTSTPSPHNRSSPERIARLRRMQSNHTLGSKQPRQTNPAASSVPRQPIAEPGSPKNQASGRGDHALKAGLHRDQMDPSSGGSKMVDLFLSNRLDLSSDDAVFI